MASKNDMVIDEETEVIEGPNQAKRTQVDAFLSDEMLQKIRDEPLTFMEKLRGETLQSKVAAAYKRVKNQRQRTTFLREQERLQQEKNREAERNMSLERPSYSSVGRPATFTFRGYNQGDRGYGGTRRRRRPSKTVRRKRRHTKKGKTHRRR
jgi:hypothetical protein